ncbi:mediator complex subunit 31 isoform X14 [Oratosquilla oratoria]|uniref:mediator complex subunit 31 isoform X14 n=1 Tax=Oratosquilla oratoria TaxID=337810 RepID=UPI003F75D1D2
MAYREFYGRRGRCCPASSKRPAVISHHGHTPIALIAALHFGYILMEPLPLFLTVLTHISRKVVKGNQKKHKGFGSRLSWSLSSVSPTPTTSTFWRRGATSRKPLSSITSSISCTGRSLNMPNSSSILCAFTS